MSFFFKKKQMIQAIAEVLEDGRAKMGRETKQVLNIAVRVLAESNPPFEATMKAGYAHCFLLLPGVKVLAEYKLGKEQQVTLIDDLPAILARNPQLKKEA